MNANAFHLVLNPLVEKNNKWYLLLSTLVLAGVHVWGSMKFLQLPMGSAVADALLSWFTLSFLVFVIVNTLSFYHPKKGAFLMVVLLPLLLAFGWQQFTQWVLTSTLSNPTYLAFLPQSSFYRLSISYLIFVGAFLFALLWFRLGEREDARQRQQETDRLAKEAELFKLRQQLQPHFLFNSLNSINALIGSKPTNARIMVQQLSAFLRGTLREQNKTLVTLKEELEHLHLYLEIEQVRFGKRLGVAWAVEEGIENQKVPPLILQPILENAIKFGLYGTLENITIEISISLQSNSLQVVVKNPFDEDEQPSQGTGFGLKSVQRRLQLLYGQVDLLQVKQQEHLFTASLKIPQKNE